MIDLHRPVNPKPKNKKRFEEEEIDISANYVNSTPSNSRRNSKIETPSQSHSRALTPCN